MQVSTSLKTHVFDDMIEKGATNNLIAIYLMLISREVMSNQDNTNSTLQFSVLPMQSKAELIAAKLVMEYLVKNKLNFTIETVTLESFRQNSFSLENLSRNIYPEMKINDSIINLAINHKNQPKLNSNDFSNNEEEPRKKRSPKRKLDLDEIYAPTNMKSQKNKQHSSPQNDGLNNDNNHLNKTKTYKKLRNCKKGTKKQITKQPISKKDLE